MPAILRPWPATAAERRKKPLPEGRLKYSEMALAALTAYEVDMPLYLAVDTETTGLGWFDIPFAATMTWRDPAGRLRSWYFELDEPGVHDACQQILDLHLQHAGHLVFHNAKFDLQKLMLVGLLDRPDLDAERIHDTEALAHLLDEHQIKKLKVLAQKYLSESTRENEVLKIVKRTYKLTAKDGYDRIPRIALMPYALKDTEYTLRIFEKLHPLFEDKPDLDGLRQLEQQLCLVLYDMEAGGFRADTAYLDDQVKAYGNKILDVDRQLSSLLGQPIGDEDGEFNPASNDQLVAALANRGSFVASVDKEALSHLDDPLAALILERRGLAKIRNTYLLPALQEQRDGVIHPNFRQHGTVTGRMSAGSAQE